MLLSLIPNIATVMGVWDIWDLQDIWSFPTETMHSIINSELEPHSIANVQL